MVIALLISGTFTMAFSIALLFCVGDLTTALQSPTKFPIIQIFYTATKSKGATTAMVCALISTLVFATFGTLASASRLTWAFARDKGFPFSEYFAYVSIPHPTTMIRFWTRLTQSFPGQQKLHDPRARYHPHDHRRHAPRPRQHRFLHRLRRPDLSCAAGSLHFLPAAHRPPCDAPLQQEGNPLGPIYAWQVGAADQPFLDRVFGPADRVHGVPAVPACRCEEHELFKRDFWGGDGVEFCHVVYIWEEGIWGPG